MENRASVVLADASEEYRMMLKKTMETTGEFQVLGSTGSGVEALRLGSLWWLQLIVCVALLATDVGLILSKTGSGASVQ